MLCVAEFYLYPDHDAMRVRDRLLEVALTSPYLELQQPVTVIVSEQPFYTRYRLKGYVVDCRDEFQFITDITIRGKKALTELGVKPALIALPTAAGIMKSDIDVVHFGT